MPDFFLQRRSIFPGNSEEARDGDVMTIGMGGPLTPVLLVFSSMLGIAVLRTLPALVSFYSEFKSSGLELEKHRGYGQSACKAFGRLLSLIAF